MAISWLHCNICLKLPSNCKFYISSCGHVGCQSCFERKWLAPTCKKCNAKCNVLEINKDLNEDIRMYFTNIADHVKKSFTHLKEIIGFQHMHSTGLMKHKMELIKKLQMATEKQPNYAAIIEKLRHEVNELKVRNHALETENQNLNSSFRTQQNVINQFLTVNNTSLNVTPSFMHSSRDTIVTPSFMRTSRDTTLDESRMASMPATRSVPSKSPSVYKPPVVTPSFFVNNSRDTSLTPSFMRISRDTTINDSRMASMRSDSRMASMRSDSRMASMRSDSRMASMRSDPRMVSMRSDSRMYSMRSDSRMASRRSRSVPPKRPSLYKPPLVTPVRPIQSLTRPSQSARSTRRRVFCPHAPTANCRCQRMN